MNSLLKNMPTRLKKAIVIWGDDPHLPHLNYTKRVVKFGVKDGNDVQAKNVINNEEGLSFDVYIYGDLFWTFSLYHSMVCIHFITH